MPWVGIVLSFVFLLGSMAVEYFLQLAPCPLCLLQRLCLVGMFIFLGSTLVINSHSWRKISYATSFLFALFGEFVALKLTDLWPWPVQLVPCQADFETQLEILGFIGAVRQALQHGHDCLQIQGWWGQALPYFGLGAFGVLIALQLYDWGSKSK